MSCLFNSLEYFLELSSKDIRSKICDYLDNNKKLFDGVDTKDLLELESDNYVKKMRKNSTWGGAIEIKAACNIWNLEIIVYNIRNDDKNNSEIQFIPNNGIDVTTKKICLTWNGFHYEPVTNIQSKFNKKKKNNENMINNNDDNKYENKDKKKSKKYEIINKKNKKNNNSDDLNFTFEKDTKKNHKNKYKHNKSSKSNKNNIKKK
jgi:hypothetical protein